MVKLSEFDRGGSSHQPTFVIIEVFMENEETTLDGNDPATVGAARASVTESSGLDEHEGTSLLRHISSKRTESKLPKLVFPIAMVHNRRAVMSTGTHSQTGRSMRPSSGGLDKLTKSNPSSHWEPSTSNPIMMEPPKMFKCLDAGAADVLPSPLIESHVSSLTLHAYRAHKEALKERAAILAAKRNRKRSWVGFDDKRPYAYLREQMYVWRL